MGYVDTKKLKRQGEMTEPWGTPQRTFSCLEVEKEYRQAAVLPRRYAASHLTVLWGREELEMAVRSLEWSTMSKAFDRSNDIMAVRRGGLG